MFFAGYLDRYSGLIENDTYPCSGVDFVVIIRTISKNNDAGHIECWDPGVFVLRVHALHIYLVESLPPAHRRDGVYWRVQVGEPMIFNHVLNEASVAFMLWCFGPHFISGVGLQSRGPKECLHGRFVQEDFKGGHIEQEF